MPLFLLLGLHRGVSHLRGHCYGIWIKEIVPNPHDHSVLQSVDIERRNLITLRSFSCLDNGAFLSIGHAGYNSEVSG